MIIPPPPPPHEEIYKFYCELAKYDPGSLSFSDLLLLSGHANCCGVQLRKEEEHRENADRWEKLMRLAGHPQNSSDSVIKFWWDDATNTANIGVGIQSFWSSSFEGALDKIPDVCRICSGSLPCLTCEEFKP